MSESSITNEKLIELFQGVTQIGLARPGDTVIITFGRRLTDEQGHLLDARLKELFPHLTCMILDGALNVAIMRPGEERPAGHGLGAVSVPADVEKIVDDLVAERKAEGEVPDA